MFNFIYVGYLVIVNYIVEYIDFDQVWLVVILQNFLKVKLFLLVDYYWLVLVKEVICDNMKLWVLDIEFFLLQLNYMVNMFVYLKEKYLQNDFSFIMGEDNFCIFYCWKNYDYLLENFWIFVYL